MAEEKTFTERLVAQFSVLAAYVIFTGLVSTEAYYSVFGIHYQTLQFPATHIVYRGLTAVASDWVVVIPLILAIGWLIASDVSLTRDAAGRTVGAGLALAALLIVGLNYRLAVRAGVRAGESDASTSSALPRIETLDGGGAGGPQVGDAILWIDDHEMIAFTPVPNANAVPILKRVARSEVHGFSFARP